MLFQGSFISSIGFFYFWIFKLSTRFNLDDSSWQILLDKSFWTIPFGELLLNNPFWIILFVWFLLDNCYWTIPFDHFLNSFEIFILDNLFLTNSFDFLGTSIWIVSFEHLIFNDSFWMNCLDLSFQTIPFWQFFLINLYQTLFSDMTRDSISNNLVIDVYCRCLQI